MSESKTPRTDGAAVGFARLLVDRDKRITTELVDANFARRLETELTALREQLRAAERDAAIGAVVWKFIDRMKDIAPESGDGAERILNEFTAAVQPAFDAAIGKVKP